MGGAGRRGGGTRGRIRGEGGAGRRGGEGGGTGWEEQGEEQDEKQ